MASNYPFLSVEFIVRYSSMVSLFGLYAAVWQRVLEKVDLGLAYAAKSLVVVYSLFWAALIFRESITLNNLAGSALVITGVILAGRE